MLQKLPNKPYINGFDSLRFIAFIMVFLSHIQYHFTETSNQLLIYLKRICQVGYLGVDLFFVLSAFLLSSITLSTIDKTGRFSLKKYFKRRALRILPLYFIILIITFSIPYIQSYNNINISNIPSIIYFLTFSLNFKALQGDQFLMVILWSISVEVQFYIFNAIILKMLKKYFLIVNILLVFLSLVFRWINLDNHLALHYHTFSVISCFAIGNILALIVHKNQLFMLSNKIRIVGFISLLTLIVLYPYILEYKYIVFFEKLIFPVCFAFLIMMQLQTGVLNFRSYTKSNYLGKISYGLYCYHGLTIATIIAIFDTINFQQSKSLLFSWVFLPTIILLATIILSYISFKFFENKFLKLK